MIVNVKGIGKVTFPEGMGLDEINDILTKTFAGKDTIGIEEIKAIVKGIVGEATPPPTPAVVPDVKVEAPTVTITNDAADMKPIADAILKVLSKPEPNINVVVPEQKRATITDIEIIERDTFGNIKKLRMTEVG